MSSEPIHVFVHVCVYIRCSSSTGNASLKLACIHLAHSMMSAQPAHILASIQLLRMFEHIRTTLRCTDVLAPFLLPLTLAHTDLDLPLPFTNAVVNVETNREPRYSVL
jgi:hypothetical protein